MLAEMPVRLTPSQTPFSEGLRATKKLNKEHNY